MLQSKKMLAVAVDPWVLVRPLTDSLCGDKVLETDNTKFVKSRVAASEFLFEKNVPNLDFQKLCGDWPVELCQNQSMCANKATRQRWRY